MSAQNSKGYSAIPETQPQISREALGPWLKTPVVGWGGYFGVSILVTLQHLFPGIAHVNLFLRFSFTVPCFLATWLFIYLLIYFTMTCSFSLGNYL